MIEIAKEDIIARLKFDNPWWQDNQKIQFENEPRRKYFRLFFEAVSDLKIKRANILMGPRRVGKTVMIYHAIKELIIRNTPSINILYISLETPIYTGLSLEKLLGLFQELFTHGRDSNLFIFFDEIQYLKNWEVHLKSLVDSYPDYKFTATGSAAAALKLKSNESGAGRFSDYVLPPLSFAEYLLFINREKELVKEDGINPSSKNAQYSTPDIHALNEEFINYLNYGGYPEAVFSETIRSNPLQYIKSDIIDKVLLRDLPSLYGISDIQELNKLFTTLAYNTGNEISLEQLSKTSGVAKNTIKRYLEYLEAAFLIRRIERVDQNSKRFKRAVCFKVYLTNPSMRAALFGQVTETSEAMGQLAETAIFSQWQHSRQTELYYARWSSGEVDIVHLHGSNQKPFWAVEAKWSDRPYQSRSELDNCVYFANGNPTLIQPLLITSKTVQDLNVIYKNTKFEFRPTSLYAYTLGNNLLKYEALSRPTV